MPPPPRPKRDTRALTRERYALDILAGFATATRGSVVEMDPQSNARAAVAWADALMAELGRRYTEDTD
jgi:hypothetical protein